MVLLKSDSLDWALEHINHYYDSDFFPDAFEFDAIKHGWGYIKSYLMSIDLDDYIPSSPLLCLAPKANGTFRVVHRLDPLDALLYTALVYELFEDIENYRLPESENIACSYRIKPDASGSFFDKEDTGWDNFAGKTKELIGKFDGGYVLVCDIADFYNQIYIHRIQNVLEEAGSIKDEPRAKTIETFLIRLNTKTSQGIPVGPAASILLAEVIMADIDSMIYAETHDFVRWVDDIRIFFSSEWEATYALHDLTRYLYSTHRLILSGEKTMILPVADFKSKHFRSPETEEALARYATAEELAHNKVLDEFLSSLPPYSELDIADDLEIEYEHIYVKMLELSDFEIISKAYPELFEKALQMDHIDMPMLRHLLRAAGRYRIRSITPIVLQNFVPLLPVIREVVIYLKRILNKELIMRNSSAIEKIISSDQMNLPYVSMWISYLLADKRFEGTPIPSKISIRDRALIARRDRDTTWVKSNKAGLDNLSPWDRRAVIYSASILSHSELKHWAGLVASKGDPLDKALAEYVITQN